MSWFRKPKYTTLTPVTRNRIPQGLWVKCPECRETVPTSEYEALLKVCPKCNHHERLTARQRIDMLLDKDTFEESDADLTAGDPLKFSDSKSYTKRLTRSRRSTGLSEAVVTGLGRIQGQVLSLAVMDMNFIGGSMGIAVGEKIARSLETALEKAIPALLVCCSGGARMQEGILSLMQMAKTCAVAGKLHQEKLPLITVLTDPTTGGVSASFAMIGDVVLAEPNALIGFAGPRVIEQTIRQVLPPGFQRSEFLAEHGFVDHVCQRTELRPTIANLLGCFMFAQQPDSLILNGTGPKPGPSPQRVSATDRASSAEPAEVATE